MRPAKLIDLNEDERKVLATLEHGYEFMVAIVPHNAGVNDFAAAFALASLKQKGLVKFEGRGARKVVYATPEGLALRKEMLK